MGETSSGQFYCDYCGREILNEVVMEKYWSFHSEICQANKHRLLKKSEDDHDFRNHNRSLYHAFQDREDN